MVFLIRADDEPNERRPRRGHGHMLAPGQQLGSGNYAACANAVITALDSGPGSAASNLAMPPSGTRTFTQNGSPGRRVAEIASLGHFAAVRRRRVVAPKVNWSAYTLVGVTTM